MTVRRSGKWHFHVWVQHRCTRQHQNTESPMVSPCQLNQKSIIMLDSVFSDETGSTSWELLRMLIVIVDDHQQSTQTSAASMALAKAIGGYHFLSICSKIGYVILLFDLVCSYNYSKCWYNKYFYSLLRLKCDYSLSISLDCKLNI